MTWRLYIEEFQQLNNRTQERCQQFCDLTPGCTFWTWYKIHCDKWGLDWNLAKTMTMIITACLFFQTSLYGWWVHQKTGCTFKRKSVKPSLAKTPKVCYALKSCNLVVQKCDGCTSGTRVGFKWCFVFRRCQLLFGGGGPSVKGVGVPPNSTTFFLKEAQFGPFLAMLVSFLPNVELFWVKFFRG